MAERLGDIFSTEEDKVNCPFYNKIGACRHGDKCIRLHNKPMVSQTIILQHLYQNPPVSIAIAEGQKVSDDALNAAIRHFEDFYEEVFLELIKFGEIQELNICDNLGDHMIGNVIAKFGSEEEAEIAIKALNGRYYAGKPIVGEYSPVIDFRESKCRQYEEGSCGRGGYCNFMHLKYISKSFKNSLFDQMFTEHPLYRDKKRSGSSNKKEKPQHSKRDRSRSNSSDGDLRNMSAEQRKKIIERWNRKYDKEKEVERRKKEAAEAKINFILLQQKLQEELNKKDTTK